MLSELKTAADCSDMIHIGKPRRGRLADTPPKGNQTAVVRVARTGGYVQHPEDRAWIAISHSRATSGDLIDPQPAQRYGVEMD